MDLAKVLNDAKSFKNDDLSSYEEIINNELKIWNNEEGESNVDVMKFACALLKELQVYKGEPKKESSHEETKIQFAKLDDTQRFFINIGRVDGLDENKLFKFIKSLVDGITLEDFADIYICGTYSFFETKSELKDEILEKVQNIKYGERDVRVELSEKKKDSGKRERSSHSFSGRRDFSHRGSRRDDRKSFGRKPSRNRY